ncbi:MAG: hypothetical protein MUQ32_06050 [Chloroflexi bacterium]|nr:hypothetical protein [Chloroflexota bacterium]
MQGILGAQGTVMFKMIFRAISVVLLGWFAFMAAAMVFAAVKRRESVPQDPAADEVDLVAAFAPLEFSSEASAFRGGSVTTWFGGGTLDLRGATLDPEGATLRVNALFGGGNLVVPETWDVQAKVTGIGGVGDGRPKAERPADAPTLRFEGTAVFGGWGITSEPADTRELEGASA